MLKKNLIVHFALNQQSKQLLKKANNDNYRPISMLPCISKIFEKAVFIQSYDYSNINNLLCKSQYGFHDLHSTEMAPLETTDILAKDIDTGKDQ